MLKLADDVFKVATTAMLKGIKEIMLIVNVKEKTTREIKPQKMSNKLHSWETLYLKYEEKNHWKSLTKD